MEHWNYRLNSGWKCTCFLLASPEILQIVDDFWSTSQNLNTEMPSHYQLQPAYKERLYRNVQKLCYGMLTHLEKTF